MRLLAPLAAVAAFALGSGVALFAAGPPMGPAAVVMPYVEADRITLDPQQPQRASLGRLRFLGAIALRSHDGSFGGWSGLAYAPGCGRLLAISDTGNWMTLEPRLDGERLTGINDVRFSAARDAAGRPAARKVDADAESLAWTPAETLIAFEQDHRVRRYRGIDPCRPETLVTAAVDETRPAGWSGWPSNGGAEAMARSPDGALLLAVSESAERGDGGRAALLSRGPGTPALRFTLRPPEGLEPTDAVWLDDRRVLVLNRAFSPMFGSTAALTLHDLGYLPARARVNGQALADVPDVAPGAELARLVPPLPVDNMEGLALERRDGRTFLWMLSDDNFNPAQRTLLMRWELAP